MGPPPGRISDCSHDACNSSDRTGINAVDSLGEWKELELGWMCKLLKKKVFGEGVCARLIEEGQADLTAHPRFHPLLAEFAPNPHPAVESPTGDRGNRNHGNDHVAI